MEHIFNITNKATHLSSVKMASAMVSMCPISNNSTYNGVATNAVASKYTKHHKTRLNIHKI